MTKDERNDIERLCKLQVASMPDKQLAYKYVKLYVNPSGYFCLTCDDSVKLMFNQLKKWWSNQNVNAYQFIKTK